MFHLVEGAGSPVGVVTPTHKGQHYLNTTDDSLWQAFGTTNTSWKNLTPKVVNIVRLFSNPTSNTTLNVNSISYIVLANPLRVDIDFDEVQWTHFAINVRGLASTASQTVTLQLAEFASPGTPLSSAGGDLAIPNTQDWHLSGWVAFANALTGVKALTIAAKGSDATVDLSASSMDLILRRDP